METSGLGRSDSSRFQDDTGRKHGKELCLLALDGGGVRGTSELYILQRIMENISPGTTPTPKPCDFFDMIGGTSTGGIIAIMLGRLEMSVEACIEAYNKLCPKVFSKRHSAIRPDLKVRGRFDHEALENGVKQILRDVNLDVDTLLKNTSGGCHTYLAIPMHCNGP